MDIIKAYCGRHDLKFKQFAELVKISPAYLSQIRSGLRTPSLVVCLRMANVTGGEIPVSHWYPKLAESVISEYKQGYPLTPTPQTVPPTAR